MNKRIDKEFIKIVRLPQLLVALMLSFTVFVFAPVNAYQLNRMNFDFTSNLFLIYLAIPFTATAVVLWGIMTISMLAGRKAYIVTVSALFGIGVAFYIQGNFHCLSNSVLMGGEPEWTTLMRPALINLAVWFLITVVSIVFAITKARIFLKTALYASALLIVMEGGILAVTGFLSQRIPETSQRAYSTVKDEFTVSENGDIIVFLLDAFDTRYMQMAMDAYPEWMGSFSDFTYYPNTSSTYQRTEPSYINMLTRTRYYNQEPFYTWVDIALQDEPFFTVLRENGYTLDFYAVPDNLFPLQMADVAENVKKPEVQITHPYSFVYTLEFGPLVLQPFMYGDYAVLLQRDYELTEMKSTWFEADALERMRKHGGYSLNGDSKYFKFYHFQGAHSPGNLDRYGNTIDDSSGTLDEQALGSLNIVGQYLQALKDCGAYDSSMIVIMGDHGRQDSVYEGNNTVCNTIFLTKYPGQRSVTGEITVNEVSQVSLEDLAATCMDGAGLAYDADIFGKPARDWDGTERERIFYAYRHSFTTMNGDTYLEGMQEYKVPQDARDLHLYELTGKTIPDKQWIEGY